MTPRALVLLLLLSPLPALAQSRSMAAINYNIRLHDPNEILKSERDGVIKNLAAAVQQWGLFIDGKGILEIELHITPTPAGRLDGRSFTNTTIGEFNGRQILREGAAHKLITGHQGQSPSDILIRLDPRYLAELWIDPDPAQRKKTVPNNRMDLVSVFAHELGHAFGINSFRGSNGQLPPGFIGDFDRWMSPKPSGWVFSAPHTLAANGGPLTITSQSATQNFAHYDGDGLMNGSHIHYGRRYTISAIDLAILKDLGLPLK